jgi:catechol 2,3-dioxygenase-like lactoylglutathione lyase family enzyme
MSWSRVEEAAMLGARDAIVTIAVKDLDVAKGFYEGTVGLRKGDMDVPGGVLYRSGNTTVLVYESEYAGTNQATAVSWAVGDDFDQVLGELREKGVTFEHYDLPGMTLEGDVHTVGDFRAAWFKDPDGNILNIVSQ